VGVEGEDVWVNDCVGRYDRQPLSPQKKSAEQNHIRSRGFRKWNERCVVGNHIMYAPKGLRGLKAGPRIDPYNTHNTHNIRSHQTILPPSALPSNHTLLTHRRLLVTLPLYGAGLGSLHTSFVYTHPSTHPTHKQKAKGQGNRA
jgi:hypothetical protein